MERPGQWQRLHNLYTTVWTLTLLRNLPATDVRKTSTSTGAFDTSNGVSGTPTPASCDNGSNGDIDVTVTGGAPGYMYEWNYNFATTQDLHNVPAGIYNLTVTDQNLCKKVHSFIVVQPPIIKITSVVTNATCGQNNGVVDITVTGGTPGLYYTYGLTAKLHRLPSRACKPATTPTRLQMPTVVR